MNKELELQYKELSKFNTTRLLEIAYKNNMDLPQDFIEKLNFHEKGKTQFMLKNEMAYVDETLALNCISTLPLEVYKKYIKPSWIVNINENMVDQFNYHATYEFLDYLLDICVEYNKTIPHKYSERNKQQSDFYYKYNNDFLDMLIDFDRLVDKMREPSKEEVSNNLKLFKKALKEKFKYANIERQIVLGKNEVGQEYTPENWFKHYNYIKGYIRSNLEMKDFINKVVKKSKNLEIFLDIMNQYKEGENNPFLTKEVFALAFKEQNSEVVKYLAHYISQEDKVEIFYDTCKKWNNNTAREIHQYIMDERHFKDKENIMHGGKMNLIKWYINTIQKLVPEHEIEWEKTGYIFLNLDEKYFNELLENNPKIKTAHLVKNFNIDCFKIGLNTFNDLVDSYGYGENYKLNEEINYQYIVHLSKIYQPNETIYLERNNLIKYFIIDNLLRRNPDTNEVPPKYIKDFEEFWEVTNLSQELERKVPKKPNASNKKKI